MIYYVNKGKSSWYGVAGLSVSFVRCSYRSCALTE